MSQTAAPRFEIGPVVFEFIDNVTLSDFYPRNIANTALDTSGFDSLLGWMHEGNADWLARVSVDGCDQKRAEEIW